MATYTVTTQRPSPEGLFRSHLTTPSNSILSKSIAIEPLLKTDWAEKACGIHATNLW